jgi:hypothetical protein
MQSKAKTVPEYLKALPEDRRKALTALRKVIVANLDEAYVEGMSYGMISYCVPLSVYPAGYHVDPKQSLPFACLSSQKNHMAMYLMCIYGSPVEEAWFRAAWAKTGKRLDMGKSCVRFKKLEDLPLDVIGEAIRRMPAKKYIANYEAVLQKSAKSKANGNANGKAKKA